MTAGVYIGFAIAHEAQQGVGFDVAFAVGFLIVAASTMVRDPRQALTVLALAFAAHAVLDIAHRPGLAAGSDRAALVSRRLRDLRRGDWCPLLPADSQTMTHTDQTADHNVRTPWRSCQLTVAWICALAVWASSPAQGVSAQAATPPKLVVILVVDQMRVDYLQWYASNYSAGFARLLRDGAWFTEAAYPYLNTITCAGPLDHRHRLVPLPARDDPEQLVRPDDRQDPVLHRRSDGDRAQLQPLVARPGRQRASCWRFRRSASRSSIAAAAASRSRSSRARP